MPWLIPIPCHVVGDLGSLPLAASDVAVSALGRHSKSTSSARTGSHSFCSPICARRRRGGSASCPSCCMPRCHGAHACTPRVSFSPCMQGRVVNIGSVAGLIATPLASTYSATKFALEALTDALRREVHLSVLSTIIRILAYTCTLNALICIISALTGACSSAARRCAHWACLSRWSTQRTSQYSYRL